MHHRFPALLLCLAALVLTACAQDGRQRTSGYSANGSGWRESVARSSGFSDGPSGSLQSIESRGTGRFLNTSAAGGERRALIVPAGGEDVEVELVDAGIEAAAAAVLGDALGLSYVIADGVSGRITIRSTGPVPKQALFDLFEAALASNEAIIEKRGEVYRILPGTSGSRAFRLASDGIGRGASIIVAPLRYISAAEMTSILEPLVADGLGVVADKPRNLILLSGPASAVDAALDALNLFDVDVMEGKSVALVPLSSADPTAIVGELEAIFDNGPGGALESVLEFVPNKRIGAVLVISSRPTYLDRATRWIRDLDKTATGNSDYLRTYDLMNRQAADIAPILNEMLGGAQTVSGDLEGGAVSPPNGGAKVAADASKNALIVRADRAEHNDIQNLLLSLDTPPRQVLLEATIAEVTLNEEIDVGVRWFFESGNWDYRFSDLSSGGVSGSAPGFSAVFSAGGARAALSALSSITDVKVISSPTLMVLDNQQGVLQIGDEVPIATQTSTDVAGDGSLVLTQIDYRDTGIILEVRPRIGAGGRVSLDIVQEVSDVTSTRTSGIDSPTISQRRVQTSVALSNGQTLALGGLIQEDNNQTSAEVPGLGRVPVMGNLFRSRNSGKGRTELLILIRPRVVNDALDGQLATNSWRSRIPATSSMLDTGLGSPRHTISDVLR